MRKGAIKNVHGGQSGRDASQPKPIKRIKRSEKSESYLMAEAVAVIHQDHCPSTFGQKVLRSPLCFQHVSTCAIKLQGFGSHQSMHFASWKSLACCVFIDLPFFNGFIPGWWGHQDSIQSMAAPTNLRSGDGRQSVAVTETWLNRSVKPVSASNIFKYRTSGKHISSISGSYFGI